MDYEKHYERLVLRAKNRAIFGYTEAHHILPKCMGGADDNENIVNLTPEEHYVAHQLLVKMYPKNGALIYAARLMTVESKNHPYRNNKLYGWLKRKHVVECRTRTGRKNHRYGTMWITDGKESKVIQKDDPIPSGWSKGRVLPSLRKHSAIKQPSKYEVANQELLKALQGATSISGALRDLGLQCRGNNYARAKRLIIENGLQDRFNHPRIAWDA